VHKSLSARLLILTILFVMLAEVMIFLPSVARYRISWLEERLGAAHLAILTLDAAPDAMVSEALQDQLLSFVGVRSIAVRRADARLVLLNDMPPEVDASYDLAEESPLEMIHEALRALWSDGDAVIRVVGPSPKTMPGEPEATIEIVLDEAPLCEAILGFAGRIFVLSLLISIVTAGLVFWVLRWQFVHPMSWAWLSVNWPRCKPRCTKRSPNGAIWQPWARRWLRSSMICGEFCRPRLWSPTGWKPPPIRRCAG